MQTHKGDILKSDADLIFIPVNMNGVMGAGLAKQFADAYPNLVYWYQQYCLTRAIQKTICIADQFLFFPTKKHWKEKSNKDDILGYLDYYLMLIGRSNAIREIALPPLGCGLGGLDWKDMRPPIVERLENFERRHDKIALVYE